MEKIGYAKVPQPSMSKAKSYRGNFQCSCGDEVDKEFLSVHMNDCQNMQKEFGDLYRALDQMVEDSPFLGTWNNIQAMVTFFRCKLNQIIEENSKPVSEDVNMEPEVSYKYQDFINEDDLGMKCMKCDEMQFEKLHFLETCAHIICKPCFVEEVKIQYSEKQKAD